MTERHNVVEMLGRSTARDSNFFLQNKTFFCANDFLNDWYNCRISLDSGRRHDVKAVATRHCLNDRVFVKQFGVDVGLPGNCALADVQAAGFNSFFVNF